MLPLLAGGPDKNCDAYYFLGDLKHYFKKKVSLESIEMHFHLGLDARNGAQYFPGA